jgi:DNA-binding transcriptional LysR family regulator
MSSIHYMNLAAVDLNLLVSLEALLEERSVTRAARRVGLSQPAMSNALGRLRALLGDHLLQRRGTRMEVTEQGARLTPLVAAALSGVRRVLDPPPAFDPANTAREFAIGLTDYAEALLLPRLLDCLARAAPRAVLRGYRVDSLFLPPEAELEEGRFDLALGFYGAAPAPHRALLSEVLWRDKNVCVAAASHPRLKGRSVASDAFLAERHAAVFYRRGGPGLMDSVLAGRGQSRQVACYTPHFASVFPLVAQTELVAAAPERLARIYARWLPLRLRVLPVSFPEFEFGMVWHQRRHGDPGLEWLRSQILALARPSKAAARASR